MSLFRQQAKRLLQGVRPDVEASSCVRFISPLSRCHYCMSACPVKGIDLEAGLVIEECIGCGRCVQICPSGVFQMDEMRILQSDKETLIVGCKHDQTSDKCDLRLECLQQLHPETVALALEKVQHLILYADEKRCAACACEWMPIGLSESLKRFGFPSFKKLSIIQEESFWESSMSRRQLLGKGVKEAAHLLRRSVDDYAEATLGNLIRHEEVHMPRMPLQALYQTYDLVDGESPYPMLMVEQCNFCGACTRLCPTRALQLIEDDEKKGLMYHPLRCNGCGLCQDVCMLRGLRWDGKISNQMLLQGHWTLLAGTSEQLCAECGRSFWRVSENGREQVCELCLAIKKGPKDS